jgi:dolichol-phosphate mannosyltransferase
MFGPAAGIKLAILICIPIASGGMFLLARRFVKKEREALIAAVAYVMASSLWMRALAVEHVVVVLAMAVFPMVCWSILRLAQNPNLLSAFLCAVICSALSLIYSKAALMAVPGLLALSLWLLWKYHGLASWMPAKIWMPLAGGLVLLAVVPNLPSLREAGSAALFEFGPLTGWQQSFSSKSALHFFDRLGGVSADFRGDFAATTAAGAYYLGIIPILCLALVLVFRRRLFAQASPGMVSAFRVSASLALFCYWLSHGPFSVFSGTLRALETSGAAADFFPAVLWLSLGMQAWIVWILIPESMPLRKPLGILLLTIYLLVPGFERISWLPLYADIRAPFDFYQVGGVVWTCLAVGVAAGLLLERISKPGWKAAVCVLAGGIWLLDFSGHLGLAKNQQVEAGVMESFGDAADFLKTDPQSGSVVAISGRYFYLQLPALTGRTLLQEAFQSYLQQRGLAALLAAGASSMEDYMQSLRIAGTAFLLIDKADPGLSKEFAAQLKENFSMVYSNEHFDVLKVEEPLAPAYIGKDAVLMLSDTIEDISASLIASKKNFVGIGPVMPGSSAGVISEGAFKPFKDFEHKDGEPFKVLAADQVQQTGRGSFTVNSPGGGGWIVVPVAWHRDWTAGAANGTSTVFQAFGGLLAAEAGDQPSTITFRFEPPWWYRAAFGIGAISWLAALIFCMLLLIPRFRAKCSAWGSRPITPLLIDRKPIQRPLAISPTYKEAESLPGMLTKLLATRENLHVLIVDDASPDGTADIVKNHPEFQKRIFLLERAGKLGLGSAYREGFRWASGNGYDACIEIDADLSHDPKDIPGLLESLESGKNDVVIGSRYLNGLRVVNWPEHRLLISSFGTQYVRFVLGMPLTDATSGFKALRVNALNQLDWSDIRAEGYGFQVELHHSLWRAGARIAEYPITFTERRDGHTKMSAAIALEAAIRVLELALPKKASTPLK